MKTNHLRAFIGVGSLGLFLFVLSFAAFAEIPKTINYQGYLTDKGGGPFDGSVSITFSIYDVFTGGTPLWYETQNVEVIGGIFNVRLGSDKPLYPQQLAFDKTYYLGIEVEQDGEMTPRQEMTSVAYSLGPWKESSDHVHYDSGNVGIGTTSPELSLHVVGPNGGPAVETMKIDSDGEAEDVPFRIRSNPTGSESVTDADTKFIVMGDGKVGIGTTTPDTKLDVEGDMHISGEITWPAKQGRLAVAPAAFVPKHHDRPYENWGRTLFSKDLLNVNIFKAAVNLPLGCTVTKISCYFRDDSPDNADLYLYRAPFATSNLDTMASLHSHWDESDTNRTFTDDIEYPTIDNYNYIYYLSLTMPRCLDQSNNVSIEGVRIHYTYTGN